MLTFNSGDLSPVLSESPITPLDATAFPPMPPLEVYTGHHNIPYEIHRDNSEYFVRDMFTPSPTSSNSPYSDPSAPLYPQYAPIASLHSLPVASTSSSVSRASLIGPSRRQTRRLSEPACLDDGVTVSGSMVNPYERLNRKKQAAGKRRKMWNHVLEKMLFTPEEISTMSAPHRRTIYTASLEAHVDQLHEQLFSYSIDAVPPEKLEPYHGLNAKTTKSMVSGLHHDGTELKLKILEIERANQALEEELASFGKQY